MDRQSEWNDWVVNNMSEQKAKPKITAGYRLGNLTVEKDTGKRKNGYVIWKCLCDCGNTINLDTRYIQRGAVTDCGCIKGYTNRQLDLTGTRIGKLVCLEPTDKRDSSRSVIWKCRCDCGNQCEVPAGNLRSGSVKSCGCLHHTEVQKEYVGTRFGYLMVQEYAGKKDGMHYWKCLCDCGNETVVGQTLLQIGKTRSCGCLRSATIQENLKLFDGTSVALLKKSRMKNNTSGHTGVSLNKRTGLWIAKITFRKQTYYLGSYKDINDAIRARLRGEEMHDDFLEWYHREYEKPEQEGENTDA